MNLKKVAVSACLCHNTGLKLIQGHPVPKDGTLLPQVIPLNCKLCCWQSWPQVWILLQQTNLKEQWVSVCVYWERGRGTRRRWLHSTPYQAREQCPVCTSSSVPCWCYARWTECKVATIHTLPSFASFSKSRSRTASALFAFLAAADSLGAACKYTSAR